MLPFVPLKGLRPQGRGDTRVKIGFCGVCFVRVAREKQCAWPAGDLDALAQNDPIDSVPPRPLPPPPLPVDVSVKCTVTGLLALLRDTVFRQDVLNYGSLRMAPFNTHPDLIHVNWVRYTVFRFTIGFQGTHSYRKTRTSCMHN